jgi:hypothetical protein
MVKENRNRPRELQGWQEIAEFLGLPITTAQRWEKSGMPVHHLGRYVHALPEELNRWVAKESFSRSPVHIATESTDLTSDLKRALSEARHRRKSSRKAA